MVDGRDASPYARTVDAYADGEGPLLRVPRAAPSGRPVSCESRRAKSEGSSVLKTTWCSGQNLKIDDSDADLARADTTTATELLKVASKLE